MAFPKVKKREGRKGKVFETMTFSFKYAVVKRNSFILKQNKCSF